MLVVDKVMVIMEALEGAVQVLIEHLVLEMLDLIPPQKEMMVLGVLVQLVMVFVPLAVVEVLMLMVLKELDLKADTLVVLVYLLL